MKIQKTMILGLASLLLASACANKTGKMADNGKGDPNAITKQITAQQKGSVDLVITDGALSAASDLDILELANALPFKNNAETGIRSLGNPTYVIKGEPKVGFVKATNVVFRGIKRLPPEPAMIKEVTKLELHLEGVRRYSEKDLDAATLSEQLICAVDAGVCAGSDPSSKNETSENLNKNFKGAVASQDLAATKLSFSHSIKDKGGKLYSYVTEVEGKESKTLVIDLKKAFNLANDKAVIEFLMKTAKPLAANGYMKFRFVIGNNTYFDQGKMVIEMTYDEAKLPKDFAEEKSGVPMNAADLKATAFEAEEVESDVDAVESEVKKADEAQEEKKEAEEEDLMPDAVSVSYDVSLEKLGLSATSETVSADGRELLSGVGAVIGKYMKAVSRIDWILSVADLKVSAEAQEALSDEIERGLKASGVSSVNGNPGKEPGKASKPQVKITIGYSKDASKEDKIQLEHALDGLLQTKI